MWLGSNIHVDVGVREWMWLNVREYTCESVLSGASMLVDVGVRKGNWLNAHESTCATLCVGRTYTCEFGCS